MTANQHFFVSTARGDIAISANWISSIEMSIKAFHLCKLTNDNFAFHFSDSTNHRTEFPLTNKRARVRMSANSPIKIAREIFILQLQSANTEIPLNRTGCWCKVLARISHADNLYWRREFCYLFSISYRTPAATASLSQLCNIPGLSHLRKGTA